MKNSLLAADKEMMRVNGLWEFFNDVNEIIYAADAETCELVYLNKRALETYGVSSLEEVKGAKCYQLLQGFSAPCDFCIGKEAVPDCPVERLVYNRRTDRHFRHKEMLREHEGHLYRLGMMTIVKVDPDHGAHSIEDAEDSIDERLRQVLLEKTPDKSLDMVMAYIGEALGSDRAYIFERSENGYSNNTYEWTAPGIQPQKENRQNLAPELYAGLYADFHENGDVIVRQRQNIGQSDPKLYQMMQDLHIRTLVVLPIYENGKLTGFFGTDNPRGVYAGHTSNVMQTTASFIGSSLYQRDQARMMKDRSENVFHALNVDYLAIYQLDLDTGKCVIVRDSPRLRKEKIVDFESGYDEAMEQYIRHYIVPQDRERISKVTKLSYVREQLNSRQKFFTRYQVIDDDLIGTNNIEIHYSILDQSGAANTAIFAFRDASAMMAREEEYKQETLHNLEEILEGSLTGIWTIERESGHAPRMYPNQTARDILGIERSVSPEECYEHWFSNIDAGYQESVERTDQEILTTGRGEIIYPWNHPSLGKIYIHSGGVINQQFDKPGTSIKGYHQDITESMTTRKRQEKSIAELLEKVRRANMVKSEFLSRMSHDLRTPINGILGMLTIMENTQDDPDRQRDCREKLRLSAEHLLSLVNDVLEVTKLESGQAPAVQEPFDLHRLLEDCVSILSCAAEEAGVRMILDRSGLRHNRVIGDPLNVKRILINILGNAIRYNRLDGRVWLRVSEGDAEDRQAEYRFVIQDTGIGMGKDFLPHVFDPFAQESNGARTEYAGVGLGLSIAKQSAERLNGGITAESQRGVGSTFTVTLPMRIDASWETHSVTGDGDGEADLSGIQVLLVEDNPINSEIVEFMLTDAGAKVVTAQDGRAAVDTFMNSQPWTFDCVLMDLMMPVMNGYEATHAIRALDRADAEMIPIIALSANAFEEDVSMAKAAGMNEHLAKPVDANKLFQTICRLSIR